MVTLAVQEYQTLQAQEQKQKEFVRLTFVYLFLPHILAKSASHAAATGSSDGAALPQTSSLRSKGLGLLNKVKMSVELLIALAALLSWLVVGVVMFDFVEYKAVPGKPQNLKVYVPKSFKPSVMQNLTNMFAIIVRHPADHNGPCPGRERRHWWVIQSAQ